MSRNSNRSAPASAPQSAPRGDASTDASTAGDGKAQAAGTEPSSESPPALSFDERLERSLTEQRADIEATLARAADGDVAAIELLRGLRAGAEQALMLIGASVPEQAPAPKYVPVGDVRELSSAERDGRTVRVLTDGVRTWKEAGE